MSDVNEATFEELSSQFIQPEAEALPEASYIGGRNPASPSE